MDIEVKGRFINQNNSYLGVRGDNSVETVRFILNRFYGSSDLNHGLAYLLFHTESGQEGYILLDKSAEDEKLCLTWKVGRETTQEKGSLRVQIKISGLADELWHSEITYFRVRDSIAIETPQPAVMKSRRASTAPRTADTAEEPPITVSERTMNIPPQLQNIAVQNDKNSETVRLLVPRYFDGHDLSSYLIKLRTLNEGGLDYVVLSHAVSDSELSMDWTLKPPQTSYSGKLSIQLQISGNNFEWQTAESSVNILRQIDGEPIIPVTPPVMEEFLKQIAEIAQNAKLSETNSASSASTASSAAINAENSAKAADNSAKNARVSEENAKKSETGAAGSLTDINTGLLGKLSISEANQLFKAVQLNESTGIFTFTRFDNTVFTIDTRLEQVVVNFRLDPDTLELVLVLADGTEQRVSLVPFLNLYTGGSTSTVEVQVSGTTITAQIKGNSIGINLLTPDLQEIINSKVSANQPGNANQIKFADGKTMQEKLDSGELNGKDGITVEQSGLFYMRIDEFGHLKIGVPDAVQSPPLSIRNGKLIYTIE